MLLCISLLITGCSNNVQETAEHSSEQNTEVTDDFVLLGSIQPPTFAQRYAVAYYSGVHTDLFWGRTSDPITTGYFWEDSSLPGFCYTILIQIDYFEQADIVQLITRFGHYTYKFSKQYAAFLEDGNLLGKETGSNVNTLDADTETLAIYSSVSGNVYEYELVEGTVIKIE